MDYGMIGKIQKAKRYAQERDRIHFDFFRLLSRARIIHIRSVMITPNGIAIVIFSRAAVDAAIPWH